MKVRQFLTMPCMLITVVLLGMSCSAGGGGSEPGANDALLEDSSYTAEVTTGDAQDNTADASDLTAEDGSDEDSNPLPCPECRPVVFSVISDIHLVSGSDHWTATKVRTMLQELGGLDPACEFVAITGDLLDVLYEPRMAGPGSMVQVLLDLVDGSPVPVELLAGNHDYYRADHPTFLLTSDHQARESFIEEHYGIPPYRVEEVGGVRFFYLQTMSGELWNQSSGLTGSLGQLQLNWLDERLAEGGPSVLFLHHPPDLLLETSGGRTLEEVVAVHSGKVLGIFAGHLHLWARKTVAGVPLFLTTWLHDAPPVHYHVRVDPALGTLTILNEADIPFGEVTHEGCDPTESPAVASLEPLAGTIQELVMTAAQADAGAFGTYLEEGLGYVAFALRLQTPDPSGLTFPALVSLGYYSGNASVGLPAYVQSASGIPCLAVQMMVTNPCFETQPVDLLVDLNKALPFGLPSHWKLRVWFNDLTLSGAFSTEGTPHIQQGLLHAQVDLLQAVEDVKMIIVDEYCKGKIATCAPGTGGLPTCPQTPDEGFFPQIPTQCDATFFGIGMRLILTMLESAPEGQGSVKASFVSMVPVETKTTQAGGIHPDVFSVEPGRNCYEASQSFR